MLAFTAYSMQHGEWSASWRHRKWFNDTRWISSRRVYVCI